MAELEADKCRSVFPEGIWLLIAEKVSHFAYYHKLCQPSEYFGILFKNLGVRFMSPQVLKILYAQLKINFKEKKSVMSKCRMVCRTWQKNIDEVLENLPNHYMLILQEERHFHRRSDQFLKFTNLFSEIRKITRFRQIFDGTHANSNRNPFICRSATFYLWSKGEFNNPFQQILQLLRNYGHHIWHCEIVLFTRRHADNALEFFRKLYEMLELLPNVRTLYIWCQPTTLTDTIFQNLKYYVEQHPFLKLNKLHSLSLRDVPTPVSDGLMRANPHITSCYVWRVPLPNTESSTILGHGYSSKVMEEMPTLHQFGLLLSTVEQFKRLEIWSPVWSLRKFCASLLKEIPLNDLIRLLGNNWSAKLKELTLDVYEEEQLLELGPLHLPNLQMFSLRTQHYTPSDFLLPTKNSLKELILRVQPSRRTFPASPESVKQAEKTVKFYDFRSSAAGSNIWSIFPKLRSVEYFDWWVGREEYRRRQRLATHLKI